jgi:hypothetical protein
MVTAFSLMKEVESLIIMKKINLEIWDIINQEKVS